MLYLHEQPGGRVWVSDAIDWTGTASEGHLKIGIMHKSIAARAGRGLSYMLGQMYGVVGLGMIRAQHVYKGLKRGMLVDGDGSADRKKLAVTWSAKYDAKWVGPAENGQIVYEPAPDDRVFVVYVSVNEMLEEYPDIYGWAEHWAWVASDPDLPGAPIGSPGRYDSKIWP